MQKYKIGDYVMYGMSGACMVDKIGTLDFASPDKIYYTLKPVYDDRDTIYVSVDKEDDIVRKVIGKKRAKEVIDLIDVIAKEEILIEREAWSQILKEAEHERVISMILQLRRIRNENKKNHKSLNIADAKLLTYAERILSTELSVAMGIPVKDAWKKIDEKLG